MQRRRWLQLGLGATAILAVGSTAWAWLSPGLVDGRLAPAGRMVMRAAGQAVLDASLPAGPARPAALAGLVQRLDALVADLPPHVQSELSLVLSLLAAPPGRRALAGLEAPWDEADVVRVQQALQSMRLSSHVLRRQIYQALHELSAAAWFSDASTWSRLGYPGPREI